MSSSVNRPTNVKQKDEDVERKLRLYGIYSAFSKGKAPSNKQIDVALNSALASKQLSSPSPKLSEDGQKLIADLRDVIEKAKQLFLTKNDGNILQEFIWETQHLTAGDASVPSAPTDKETAKQHGDEALAGLKTLGMLILSNGQFRKLLTDVTTLVRDIAGDAAQNAASRINPSDEKLAQIDEPAPDNTWHEVPSASELKGQARDAYNKNKPFSKADAKGAAGDATAAASPSGARDPTDAAVTAADNAQQSGAAGVDAKGGATAGAQTLQSKAKENVPEETQQKAREAAETARQQARDYLKKKVPKERREQTIWRLKKTLIEIQSHEDYKNAIETLLTLAETYGGHGATLTKDGAGTVKGVHSDNALTKAEADLKTLIERFANSTSLEDFFDSLTTIYQDAQRDPELKNWFKAVDSYIRKCLQQQGYVIEDASNDEGRRLYDQGQFLLRERYRDHTNRILDEIKFLASQFEEDPLNKAFGDAMQKLFLDLGNDVNGKPVFKQHLVKDLTSIIVPGIFEDVSYVPVPRIEVSDPQIDAIVENLVIESDNLMPNELEITSDNFFRWGRKTVVSSHKNKIVVAISGVQMDLRDVSYYIKKKQGFPSITDKGVMDIFLGGKGLSFKFGLETADKSDKQHFFKVNTVKVDIKHLKLKLKQSNHKLLFNIAKPTLMAVVKPALTKVIEKQIRDVVHKGDAFCYEIHTEAERALKEVENDPDNAPNVYARYVSAIKNKIAQVQEKGQAAKERSSKAQTNVAMTQHDSIFKDIKLPGGVSTKATEYKDLADKGDKWESPVFGIGTAKESTNIQKPAAITRKPHATTTSNLRSPSQSAANGVSGFSNEINQSFNGNANPALKTAPATTQGTTATVS